MDRLETILIKRTLVNYREQTLLELLRENAVGEFNLPVAEAKSLSRPRK